MANCTTCDDNQPIETIEKPDCFENFGQIVFMGFQKQFNGATRNAISATGDAHTLKATYTALIDANDQTKLQISPETTDVRNEPGTLREFGSDNRVRGGVPYVIGLNRSAFTGMFDRLPQKIVAQLKSYACVKNVGLFLINEYGQIGCLADDPANPTEYYGIPIRSFAVMDKKFGGYAEVDGNAFSFSALTDWSDKFVVINPADFSGLDLAEYGA